MSKFLEYKEHYLKMDGSVSPSLPEPLSEPIIMAPSFLNEIRELKAINYIKSLPGITGTFIDIGAHLGFYTIPLAYKFNKVISYEPSKFQYGYLIQNIALNKLENVIARDQAVGLHKEIKTLYVMGRSGGGNTLVAEVANNGIPMESYEVAVVALDSEEVDRLDVLKIDVEGHELDVLKGGEATIKKFKPLIICEVWDEPERREEVLRYISSLGYSVQFPYFNEMPELAFCTAK